MLKNLQIVLFSALLLYWGRMLFIPCSTALLISCMLYPMVRWFEARGMGRSISIGFALSSLLIPLSLIILLLYSQVLGFKQEWPGIQVKLQALIASFSNYLFQRFNISVEAQWRWLQHLADDSGGRVLPFIGATTYGFSVFIILALIVPLLSGLILYHRAMLFRALCLLLPKEPPSELRSIVLSSILSYYNFFKGMLIVYLMVAILNTIGLWILGVPRPLLFGTVASVLTIVPYVGIVVASLVPVSVAWLYYNSVWYALGVILVFTIVQILEANIIFPLAVSQRLKVNAMATIIAIMAGGILWGAAGMVLFIPFMGILKLIADRSDKLKVLALLLGQS